MQNWDFDVAFDDETPVAVSALGHLQRLLGALRRIIPLLDYRWPEGGPDGPSEIADELAPSLGDESWALLELDHELRRVIHGLNRVLDARPDLKGQADRAMPPGRPPQVFAPIRVFAGRKTIHLGSVDRYFVFPTLPPPTTTLAYALNKIAGTDDLLVREQHDVFGWHYHYCDRHKRRSDVLMSFDRKRLEPGKAWEVQKLVPLCWELHGVNKAQFNAKPWNWKDRKRESIYAACFPDLAIQPPLTYKPPSKEAQDVWPAPP